MSLSDLMIVKASTKRSPGIASGKRGAPTTEISRFYVMPLSPVDADLRKRLGLDSPYALWQTFAENDPNVRKGDVLVIGEAEYPIQYVEDWTMPDDQDVVVRIVVEKMRLA